MKLVLEKLISSAFILAIILLVILGIFSYRSVGAINEAIGWEIHTQEVLQKLDEALLNVVDAETGVRGFIITGNDNFLEPFNNFEQENATILAELKDLVKDNQEQAARISALETLIKNKSAISNQQVNFRKTESFESAADIVENNSGKLAMDKIRVAVKELKDAETSLLRSREMQLNQSFYRASLFLIGGTLVGIALLSLANFMIYSETRKRRLAEELLKNANKDLEIRVEERTLKLAESNKDLEHQILKREEAEINQKTALEAGELGLWTWNPRTNDYQADDRTLSFFGLTQKDYSENSEQLFEKIHPEDYSKIIEVAESSTANNQSFFVEFRIINPDKSVRWIQAKAQPHINKTLNEQHLVGFSTDITLRKEAEIERDNLFINEKIARQDAETASRMRDEFLATVSHELRNPLNAMLGWARLLQKKQLDENTSQRAVETIVRNAEAQNHLIEDMLDVSRIITGKLRLDLATIDPKDFVEAAVETVTPAAEAKNIKIHTIYDNDLNKIAGDSNRLQQVIWNLLSNSIKFTPKNGEILVEVNWIDSMIEIKIKDTGAGISKDFLPNVFDRFRQADSSTIKKFGGLGLGLAIVRHITEMHGGIVEAFSEGEGKGSTFTVKLPISAIFIEQQPEEESDEPKTSSNLPLTSPNINLQGLSILTVDDEPDTCKLLEQVLSHYGAQVKTTLSASEAFDEFQKIQPDILISDIGMPEEDGYSLIRRIRALSDEKSKKMPAIALTAFARPLDRMKALSAGFQTHVSKPVEPDELATVIASLTGRLTKTE